MSTVISARGLSKSYRSGFWKTKSVAALQNLNLEVQENEIFGYLGPNGAGKSTTLKLLMSLIYPSQGQVEILGRPAADLSIRREIGYLPENPYFYEYLTAEEFLTFYAGLFDFDASQTSARVERFLKLTGVYDARKLQLRKFSKGMIQRIGIAQALINDPKVIFLDEPMSGLDPIGRREVRDLILELKKQGRTVFFSTHILNDVETTCDRVAILNRGKLVGSGRLTDLFSKEVRHVEMVVSNISLAQLRQIAGNEVPVYPSGVTYRLELNRNAALASLVSGIEQAAGIVVSVTPVRQTMEEYFFALLQQSSSAAAPRDQV